MRDESLTWSSHQPPAPLAALVLPRRRTTSFTLVGRSGSSDDHVSATPLSEDHLVVDSWTCRHFSLSNPIDDGPGDLPALLRRVGDHIEERGIQAMDVMDVTVSQTITADGPWWWVTVYWSAGTDS